MPDRISAICLLLFGGLVVFEARRLPYWVANAPGPGFLPLWLGMLLVVASVVLLAGGFRSGGAKAPPHTVDLPTVGDRATIIRVAVIVGLTAGTAMLALVIGLVLASGVFMGATLAYLRPANRWANVLATMATPIGVWLLFVRWLAVPLPVGPLGF